MYKTWFSDILMNAQVAL